MSEREEVTRQEIEWELISEGWRRPKDPNELSEKQEALAWVIFAALAFWGGWSWGADATREDQRELYCHAIHAVKATMPREMADQTYMKLEDRYQEVLSDCSAF